MDWIGADTVLVRADAQAANERFYGVTADAMWRTPRARGEVMQPRDAGRVEERPGGATAPVRPAGRPVLKDVSIPKE